VLWNIVTLNFQRNATTFFADVYQTIFVKPQIYIYKYLQTENAWENPINGRRLGLPILRSQQRRGNINKMTEAVRADVNRTRVYAVASAGPHIRTLAALTGTVL